MGGVMTLTFGYKPLLYLVTFVKIPLLEMGYVAIVAGGRGLLEPGHLITTVIYTAMIQ